jgi:hypothetical protein
MAFVLPGQRTWTINIDAESHRTYKIGYRVQCEPTDGPNAVRNAYGLPQPGSVWYFGGDADPYAVCIPECSVQPVVTGEPNTLFDVELTFTTRPPGKDPSEKAGDPLQEKPKISISFSKTTEEATRDRFGRPIVNSAWEQLRGKQVEFDSGVIQIKIEQNLAALSLPALAAAYQTVNAVPIWGMPRRTVRLSNASVEEAWYVPTSTTTTSSGTTTTGQFTTTTTVATVAASSVKYYRRHLELEATAKGWDRDLLDESTKVLYGRWKSAVTTSTTTTTTTTTSAGATTTQAATTTTAAGATTTQAATTTTLPLPKKRTYNLWELMPIDKDGNMPDRFNPTHFVRATDPNGNLCRIVLNGKGEPAGTVGSHGLRFLCIQGNSVAPLEESEVWVPLPEPVAFEPWDSDRKYVRGDLVTDSDVKYVALDYSKNKFPVAGAAEWLALADDAPHDQGYFVTSATYAVGDMVQDAFVVAAGVIHVEKYNETDFVAALGVPEVL